MNLDLTLCFRDPTFCAVEHFVAGVAVLGDLAGELAPGVALAAGVSALAPSIVAEAPGDAARFAGEGVYGARVAGVEVVDLLGGDGRGGRGAGLLDVDGDLFLAGGGVL